MQNTKIHLFAHRLHPHSGVWCQFDDDYCFVPHQRTEQNNVYSFVEPGMVIHTIPFYDRKYTQNLMFHSNHDVIQ